MKKEEEKEDPFQLIERGNALEKSGNWWGAADALSRASFVLRSQSDSILSELASDIGGDSRKKEERKKIAELYRVKQREYLYRARDCFMKALSFEHSEDQRRSNSALVLATGGGGAAIDGGSSNRNLNGKDSNANDGVVFQEQFDPLIHMISHEEGKRRARIFNAIFGHSLEEEEEEVKEKDIKTTDVDNDEDNKGKEQSVNDGVDAKEQEDEAANQEQQQEEEEDSYDEWEKELEEEMDNGEEEEEEEKDDDLGNLESLPTAPLQQQQTAMEKEKQEGTENNDEQHQNVDEKQQLLEARLAELESSITLPSIQGKGNSTINEDENKKSSSDAERIENIRKSLVGLGMYLPPPEKEAKKSSFLIEKPMSDEDQVDLIMQQAKDEADFERGEEDGQFTFPTAARGGTNNEDDESSVVEDVYSLLDKAGMGLKRKVSKNNDSDEKIHQDLMNVLNDAANAADTTTQDGDTFAKLRSLLNLLSSAQNFLTEASVCLEEFIEKEEDDEDMKDSVSSKDDNDGDDEKNNDEHDKDDDGNTTEDENDKDDDGNTTEDENGKGDDGRNNNNDDVEKDRDEKKTDGARKQEDTKTITTQEEKANTAASSQMSDRGKKNLMAAQKCVETLIQSWP
uniref:Uncharacterized protein n=1 Tax=Ditylum brightwellii TaxID=49249 RepID=A0A7S4RHN6_9STRA